MDMPLEKLKRSQKAIDSVAKAMTEIARLDSNRDDNLSKLLHTLARAKDGLAQIKANTIPIDEIETWSDAYTQELETTFEFARQRFGARLEKELQKIGVPLDGQYPVLRAGLFNIEIDLEKGQATIWYGPQQERLDSCSATPEKISQCIQEVRDGLGSGLEIAELSPSLKKAIARCDSDPGERGVPIVQVLAEMSYLMQAARFRQNPVRENYRSYSRADFSYDLHRLRKEKTLRMTTATRAETQNRGGFLWIPSDLEKGNGDYCSRVQLTEVPQ